MFSFLTSNIFIYILIFSSFVTNNNNKTIVNSDKNFYIINNINEINVISNIIEIYDTNKMVFVKGGKFNFGNNNGLERETGT